MNQIWDNIIILSGKMTLWFHLLTKICEEESHFTQDSQVFFSYCYHRENFLNHVPLIRKLCFSQVTALSLTTLASHMFGWGKSVCHMMITAGLAMFPWSLVHEHLHQNHPRELNKNIKYWIRPKISSITIFEGGAQKSNFCKVLKWTLTIK